MIQVSSVFYRVVELRQQGSHHYLKSVYHIFQSHKVFIAPSARISEEEETTLRFWTDSLITHCLYGGYGMCAIQAVCKALGDSFWESSAAEKIVKIKAMHWFHVWVLEKKIPSTSSCFLFVFLSKNELTETNMKSIFFVRLSCMFWNLRNERLFYSSDHWKPFCSAYSK